MRLTPRQCTVLRRAFVRRFEPDARLWLFDSRADDRRRGGDIDLMVQTHQADAQQLVDAWLAFLADLHATPEFDGEKIDVVLWSPALQGQPTLGSCPSTVTRWRIALTARQAASRFLGARKR